MGMSPISRARNSVRLRLTNCPTNSNLSVITNTDNTPIFNCLINKCTVISGLKARAPKTINIFIELKGGLLVFPLLTKSLRHPRDECKLLQKFWLVI